MKDGQYEEVHIEPPKRFTMRWLGVPKTDRDVNVMFGF